MPLLRKMVVSVLACAGGARSMGPTNRPWVCRWLCAEYSIGKSGSDRNIWVHSGTIRFDPAIGFAQTILANLSFPNWIAMGRTVFDLA
jgi:hypothetical protein